MSFVRWSIPLAPLALAACGQDAPVPDRATGDTAATPAATVAETPLAGPEIRVLAFGDSLFAGYGLSLDQSYPAKLEAALREGGRNVRIVNAAVSGETSGAGANRLAFVLDAEKPAPDLVLLELGGNDLLRGLPPAETRANFVRMLEELKRRGIPVVLMGMRAPPNLGAGFARDFDALYPELAATYDATLVPFWLEAIYRRPELFQADRVHPTAAGLDVLVDATSEAIAEALPDKPAS